MFVFLVPTTHIRHALKMINPFFPAPVSCKQLGNHEGFISRHLPRSNTDYSNVHVAMALHTTTLRIRLVGRQQMAQNFLRLAHGIFQLCMCS